MTRIDRLGWVPWAVALVFFVVDLFCGTVTVGAKLDHYLAFSLRHAITPLIGIWGGFASICIVFFSKGLIHLCAAFGSRLLLAWHLPSLCGTLYFVLLGKNKRWAQYVAAMPALICIILFWVHPVGRQACLYPLYWIIPVIVGLTGRKNFFLDALGSTFTAHAIGSTLWLYGGLLTSPAAWNALIPVVAYERFGFALIMGCVFYTVTSISTLVKRKRSNQSACQLTPLYNRQSQ